LGAIGDILTTIFRSNSFLEGSLPNNENCFRRLWCKEGTLIWKKFVKSSFPRFMNHTLHCCYFGFAQIGMLATRGWILCISWPLQYILKNSIVAPHNFIPLLSHKNPNLGAQPMTCLATSSVQLLQCGARLAPPLNNHVHTGYKDTFLL
jgi:hypothetical protein